MPEGAPAAASDDVSGSEGAPAHDVSGAQPPAQAGVRSVSEAAAFDVSKNADGASAAETEGTGADPNDVTNLSPDGLKAMVTDFGGREVQPGGDFGQTAIQGREKEDGPAVKGNSVKILGVTVLEAGLTPELVTTNDPAASLSRPQSLQSLEASLVKTPEQPAAAGNGEGVNEGGSGAVLECLTPGTGGNESGSFSSDRAVEPESPASPPRKRARAGDVAALSAGDPSEPLAAQGAETIGECVLVESTPTQRAEQSLEGARAAENELQIGASPKGPQTPDQVEKARKPGEPLGQPSTRASLASRPDFQPGAPTAEPGTGVGQSTVREILPAILAGDPGGLAGQLGAGVGQLDAERSSRGSLGEGEMERGEKDPDRIVLELIRVARENEVRCRKMESRLREAEERARGAEERARGSEERARELEETARESERKSRDSEMRIRGAEERARLAEGLTRLAEARARLAEMLAGGAEERAQLAEEKARLAEESARAAEKRAWDNEMTGRALEKRLCESEAKGRELEERLRVSEGFARALEVMKRETEEHCAAEIVELKKTMKKDREDFCEAAGCLLWGKDGSDGSLTSADLIARGVVESVAALKELLEDLEGCPGQRTGGLIERARDQLLALRSDLERKQEEVGMLEMMLETRLDQREQLREGLERTREDGLETGGGVGGKDSQENTVSVGIEQATQTDGLRDGEPGQPLADAKSDRADVGGLRAELETIKQEYRELVSLFMRER